MKKMVIDLIALEKHYVNELDFGGYIRNEWEDDYRDLVIDGEVVAIHGMDISIKSIKDGVATILCDDGDNISEFKLSSKELHFGCTD